MSPSETAQEGPQRGRRLDHTAQNPGRPAGARRVGIVDAVTASHRRGHQGHHLVARVRPARGIAQVEALLDELGQAQVQGQGGWQDQPGIGHQTVVVKGDVDAVGVLQWQHLVS